MVYEMVIDLEGEKVRYNQLSPKIHCCTEFQVIRTSRSASKMSHKIWPKQIWDISSWVKYMVANWNLLLQLRKKKSVKMGVEILVHLRTLVCFQYIKIRSSIIEDRISLTIIIIVRLIRFISFYYRPCSTQRNPATL